MLLQRSEMRSVGQNIQVLDILSEPGAGTYLAIIVYLGFFVSTRAPEVSFTGSCIGMKILFP